MTKEKIDTQTFAKKANSKVKFRGNFHSNVNTMIYNICTYNCIFQVHLTDTDQSSKKRFISVQYIQLKNSEGPHDFFFLRERRQGDIDTNRQKKSF